MLLNTLIGKTRLWQGQPFLVKTWFERTASDFRAEGIHGSLGTLWPRAIFKPVFPENAVFHRLHSDLSVPNDILGVDTARIQPGIYETTILRGKERSALPELVWILSESDYIKMASHEFSESEEPEPLISTKGELERHLDGVVNTKWPDSPLRLEILYGAEIPFSFTRIEGIISTVLESFRYISVFGIDAGAAATISITDDGFEFGIEAELEYAVPHEVQAAVSDHRCSDLALIQKAKAKNEEEIDFGVTLEGGRAQIRVQQRILQVA